ncbi:MAG: ComF family protein [Rhodospirillales bacterium]
MPPPAAAANAKDAPPAPPLPHGLKPGPEHGPERGLKPGPERGLKPGLVRAGLVHAGRAGRAALDAVLPPHCGLCGTETDAPSALCPDCWRQVTFIAPPVCACCGMPFGHESAPESVCGGCLESPPVYDRARAAVLYGDGARAAVLGLKHGDRHDLADLLAAWSLRAGAEFWPDADFIMPAPLHWTRLFARRFNQSALIAKALARRTGVPARVDDLVRVKRTPSQGGLGRAQRIRNVQGAFAVRPKARDGVKGRNIVIVDDVMTTGATVNALARTLKRAGAARVDVLTAARVERAAG